MVGLGFAMVENFLYYGRSLVEGGLAVGLLTFVVCGVISPFNHPLYTSLTGIGLGLARQSDKSYVKFLTPVTGLLAAMTLHSLWNLLVSLPLGLFGLIITLLFVEAPLMLGVLTVVFFALRREGRTVRHYLTPELRSGLLTQQEYESLSSVGGRLGMSFNALIHGGFGAWRARSRFNQTVSELAFHRDRVSRGITSGEDTRREAAYVQILYHLRAQQGV